MSTLENLRSLFFPMLRMAAAAQAPAASRGALDGRNFDGIVLERGKTSGDADTLIFRDGRFRSTACDQYEYGDGPYTTTRSGDAISFEAQTESPKYGRLLFKGVVRGPRLDGTLTMIRDGRAVGEKWILAGDERSVNMSRIAVVQRPPVFLDRADTLERGRRRDRRSRAGGRAADRFSGGLRSRLSGVDLAAAPGRRHALERAVARAAARERCRPESRRPGAAARGGQAASRHRRMRHARARRRLQPQHALQHRCHHRPRRRRAQPASQGDAHQPRAHGLGLRRRHGAPRRRHAVRAHRRADLLGKLHAAGALRDVRARHRHLSRTDL